MIVPALTGQDQLEYKLILNSNSARIIYAAIMPVMPNVTVVSPLLFIQESQEILVEN